MNFSISEAWTATQASIAARFGDYALPAAAFIFLPQLVVALYGPQPETAQQAFAAVGSGWNALANLVALLGQLAILLLALRPAMPVGAAIKSAARLWPLGFVITLLFGLALVLGFLALILPGIFLLGRLLLAIPAYAERDAGIADAFSESWERTRKAWLKIAGAVLLFAVAGFVLIVVLTIPGRLVDGAEPGLLTGLLVAGGSALFTVYFSVFQAKIYQRLGAGRS